MTMKVIVKLDPVAIEFEVGSIAEAHALLTEQKTALTAMFTEFGGDALAGDVPAPGGEGSTPAPGGEGSTPAPARRGRKPKADTPSPAPLAPVPAPAPAPAAPAAPVVTAPPPMPVPAAAPPAAPAPAPVNTTPNANGIPVFLDAAANRSAPPPPAPAPIAPPLAPAAPAPVVRMADKVIAELKKRAAAAGDNGASLVTWLVQGGVVVNGATWDESIAVLQFQTDDKLAPIATALGVS